MLANVTPLPLPKLYSVNEVWNDFFKALGVKEVELKEAIIASRCYRSLADKIFLTEHDLRRFVNSLGMTALRDKLAPADTEPGQLVAVLEQAPKPDMVYLGFTPFGYELALRDELAIGYPGPLVVYRAPIQMTYTEARAIWRQAKRSGLWLHGGLVWGAWFEASMLEQYDYEAHKRGLDITEGE